MIDKGVYQAPEGLETLGQDEEAIEIEIENPDSVTITAGDMEIEVIPDEGADDFDANLAEY